MSHWTNREIVVNTTVFTLRLVWWGRDINWLITQIIALQTIISAVKERYRMLWEHKTQDLWGVREANIRPMLHHAGPLRPCFRDLDLYPAQSGNSSKGLCRALGEGKWYQVFTYEKSRSCCMRMAWRCAGSNTMRGVFQYRERTLVLPVRGALGAVGFVADMAKVQETCHIQSVPKNGIKKPWSQRSESLQGVDPRFLRNTHLVEHTGRAWRRCRPTLRGHECTGHGCQGPRKSREVKPKMPKRGHHKLSSLTYAAHPKLRKHALACITKGLRLCQPKAEAETNAPLQLSSQGSQAQQSLK